MLKTKTTLSCLLLIISCFVLPIEANEYVRCSTSAQSPFVDKLDDQNFAPAIAQGVVVVDFYADWCGPCHRFAPVFAKIAEQMQGKARFAKLNVSQAANSATATGVKTIPCVIVFRNGESIARKDGYCNEVELQQLIEEAVHSR